MDKNMLIRELAEIIGVTTPDTVINWEVRGMKLHGRAMEKVESFIEV